MFGRQYRIDITSRKIYEFNENTKIILVIYKKTKILFANFQMYWKLSNKK